MKPLAKAHGGQGAFSARRDSGWAPCQEVLRRRYGGFAPPRRQPRKSLASTAACLGSLPKILRTSRQSYHCGDCREAFSKAAPQSGTLPFCELTVGHWLEPPRV